MMSDLYSVDDNLSDEQKWALIRTERDRLLKESDFTQLSDVGLSSVKIIAWREYRQALRDVPDQFGNPDDVTFPDLPDAPELPDAIYIPPPVAPRSGYELAE